MNLIIYIFLLIIILVIFFLFYEIISSTNYRIINNLKNLNNFQNSNNSNNYGNLIVSTHNYEHKDIFLIMNYFSKRSEENNYILFADKIWNILLEPIRSNNIEFIYVTNGTVNKIINRLMNGDNVIMFLYKESDSTGLYHILNYFDFNINVYLAKINEESNNNLKSNNINKISKISNHYNSSFFDIFINNFNKHLNLNFEEFKIDIYKIEEKEIFMQKFIEKLYS